MEGIELPSPHHPSFQASLKTHFRSVHSPPLMCEKNGDKIQQHYMQHDVLYGSVKSIVCMKGSSMTLNNCKGSKAAKHCREHERSGLSAVLNVYLEMRIVATPNENRRRITLTMHRQKLLHHRAASLAKSGSMFTSHWKTFVEWLPASLALHTRAGAKSTR